MQRARSGSAAGIIITLILVLGLIGLGAYMMLGTSNTKSSDTTTQGTKEAKEAKVDQVPLTAKDLPPLPKPIEPAATPSRLDAAQPYQPKDGVIEIDLSEYAGYAGIIVANEGMAPKADSPLAKACGFKVQLKTSESENWSPVNSGKLAAGCTTVDVLAVLGRQYQVTVPILLGYSRGADQLIVRSDITTMNALAGKRLAVCQYTEADFLTRYLAAESGLTPRLCADLDTPVGANEIGLVCYAEGQQPAHALLHELTKPQPRLAGCLSWSPFTDEVLEKAGSKVRMMVSNRNLLLVADLLCVNAGFAKANPKAVAGLVAGIMEGNARLRKEPAACLPIIQTAFKWKPEDAKEQIASVHYANLPENLAFFQGSLDQAGSYTGIWQAAVTAYGREIIKSEVDPTRFLDLGPLKEMESSGRFKDQVIAIAPINKGGKSAIEGDPLLSKDIRFFFQPNSSQLDDANPKNGEYLDVMRSWLSVAPGSQLLLRGHVDPGQIETFRRQGGKELVDRMALQAKELSRQRAQAVKQALLKRFPNIEAVRLETVGLGWDEPADAARGDFNRRVEARWFTLE